MCGPLWGGTKRFPSLSPKKGVGHKHPPGGGTKEIVITGGDIPNERRQREKTPGGQRPPRLSHEGVFGGPPTRGVSRSWAVYKPTTIISHLSVGGSGEEISSPREQGGSPGAPSLERGGKKSTQASCGGKNTTRGGRPPGAPQYREKYYATTGGNTPALLRASPLLERESPLLIHPRKDFFGGFTQNN